MAVVNFMDEKWESLQLRKPLRDLSSVRIWTNYLQSLSALELDLVNRLMTLEITYRESINQETSQNHDDEKERLL